ncbi:MAG: glycosyltransferase 87 family protein [Candidatus Shapirobacteria bacterium]|nr:glycosyltransferase 87 family protein [Candidatus Shapirobacteria bacterium]
MKKIVLLAMVTYFLISPFSYHPDTKLTLRYPALEKGTVWDIYGYIDSHQLDIPDFHYPPAHYWWLKVHYPISKLVGGHNFDKWLSTGSDQASFDLNILKYNLAAKFPLLMLGLLSGFLIYLIVKRETNHIGAAKKAALFWYFNPISLYSLVIMGQNDIVAIFIFLLGIFFYKNWLLSAVLWGLASGIKSYPIIWSIIFIAAYEKNIKKFILKIVSVIAVYGIILLPWLDKDYFVKSVLNSGLSQRLFIANIPIGFEKQILIVPLLLVVVILKNWSDKNKSTVSKSSLAIIQSCLIILGFSHFNPQWMLWTIPFLSIWIYSMKITKKVFLSLMVIFFSWIILVLGFNDKYLTWGMFTPLNPGLINFPTLIEFLNNKGIDFSPFINLSQSALAGVAIWYVIRKNKIKKFKDNNLVDKNWIILIPWLLIILFIVGITNIRVQNKSNSKTKNLEISLSEAVGKQWVYDIPHSLKYFEISLNNAGLNSQDKGILLVSDNNNNSFEKEFSGFNAGVNSWLRVDIPENMFRSNILYLEIKDIDVKDALLKLQIDDHQRWAINLYNTAKPSSKEWIGKILSFWWWWMIPLTVSVLFIKNKVKSDD